MRIGLSICVVLLLGVLTDPAEASLMFEGTVAQTGVSIGNVWTILTLDSPGSSSNASGCVGWGGSADAVGGSCFGTGISGGDEQNGSWQTRTLTLGQVGITSAPQLRIVFRPDEPNNPDSRAITLDHMVLGIFSSDGSILFTSTDLVSPLVIPDADPIHPGPTGFVFRLNTEDLAAAAAAFSSEDSRIGLAASVSDATGGHDWFYVTSVTQAAGSLPMEESPEPASFVLVGAGVVAIVLARRTPPVLFRISTLISTLIS